MCYLQIIIFTVLVSSLSTQRDPRVVGGSNADIADFPYMCSLMYSGSYSCGCVILSATKILTTTQCVNGRSTKNLTLESSGHTAVGNLASPLDLSNPLIEVATLATGTNDFTHESCIFTGWGSSNSTSTFPTILQQANLTVISNSDCQNNFTVINIGEGQICVHDKTKIICLADLGSPVVCQGLVAGLASFGILMNDKCSSAYPAVFTRISYHLDWIMNEPIRV